MRELEAGGLPGLVPTDPGGDGIVVMNLDLHGFESSGGTATSGLREFCKSCLSSLPVDLGALQQVLCCL